MLTLPQIQAKLKEYKLLIKESGTLNDDVAARLKMLKADAASYDGNFAKEVESEADSLLDGFNPGTAVKAPMNEATDKSDKSMKDTEKNQTGKKAKDDFPDEDEDDGTAKESGLKINSGSRPVHQTVDGAVLAGDTSDLQDKVILTNQEQQAGADDEDGYITDVDLGTTDPGLSRSKRSYTNNEPVEKVFGLTEKDRNTSQRRKLANSNKAEPDGSFPIENTTDLKNAIRDWGRAGSKSSDKIWIKERAKALDAENLLPDDWKEAKKPKMLSFEDHAKRVADAVRGQHSYNAYVKATYADNAVICLDGKDYQVPTSYDSSGNVKLGDKIPVHAEYHEDTLHESVHVFESKDPEGKEWDVMLIQTGLSLNNRYYSKKALKEAVSLFDGIYAFADHATESELRERPERSIKDKVGRFYSPEYGIFEANGRQVEGIKARFKVIAPWLRTTLLESVRLDEPDFVGLSIDASGKFTSKNMNNKTVDYVESISKVYSVDVVTEPAAGGEFIRLVASNRGDNRLMLTKEELASLVRSEISNALQESRSSERDSDYAKFKETFRINEQKERIDVALNAATGLSDIGKEQVKKRLLETAKRRDLEDADIVGSLKEQMQYEAAFADKYGNYNNVSYVDRFKLGVTTHDRFDLAIRGLFEGVDQKDASGNRVPKFRNFRESYANWKGVSYLDADPIQMYQDLAVNYSSRTDHQRIRESVTTSQWGNIYADNLYIQLMRAYRDAPYDAWRLIVSEIQDVPDFQTQHWIHVGGYNDLATVAEDGTYPGLTSPSDQAVSYALAKRGGIDDVSFEAIVNDRVSAIRRIPQAMGRSAARTLFKYVMGLMSTSAATYADSIALYDSGTHKNTDTNALSVYGVTLGWAKMRAQAAYGETQEILGVRNVPKILVCHPSLEFVARRIIDPSDAYLAAINAGTVGTTNTGADISDDPQAFKGRLALLVDDFLTSATNWYMVADPNETPTMVVGFLNGQREPELYVQDQPTVGSVFAADKISYKVRHIYSAVVEDYRSFYQGNT